MTSAAHCSSCGAVLLWARTPAGSLMPLDNPDAVPPETRRNVVYWQDPPQPGGRWHCRVLKVGDEPAAGEATTVSHFSTCPQSQQHRKQRPQSRSEKRKTP